MLVTGFDDRQGCGYVLRTGPHATEPTPGTVPVRHNGVVVLATPELAAALREMVARLKTLVETERRFYLANKVDLEVKQVGHDVYFDLSLTDAWVWDVYRSARLVRSVRVVTFRDVNVEELAHDDDMPDIRALRGPRRR